MFIHYVLTYRTNIMYNVIKDKGGSPKNFKCYVLTKCTHRKADTYEN